MGLIPGVNLLAGLVYGAKKLYDSNTATKNESQPLLSEAVSVSAPSSVPSRSIILPPARSSLAVEDEKKGIATTVLDPQNGVLAEVPEAPKSCWAKLFSCNHSSSRPVPRSTAYALDAKRNAANANLF